MTRFLDTNQDFKCLQCGKRIAANPVLAGVLHRNHCPYCLWSRHMDLFEAGDRLSACKSPMQPIGLTFKRSYKRYTAASGGELMLVHKCVSCGRVSINRIAADDDPQKIMTIFLSSFDLPAKITNPFSMEEVTLLGWDHHLEVSIQLFGRRYQPIPSA